MGKKKKTPVLLDRFERWLATFLQNTILFHGKPPASPEIRATELAQILNHRLLEENRSILPFLKSGLRRKIMIAPTGFFCRVLFWLKIPGNLEMLLAKKPEAQMKTLYRLTDAAKRMFPFEISNDSDWADDFLKQNVAEVKNHKGGILVVINHPSMGDPIRSILVLLSLLRAVNSQDQRQISVVAPVNLPWYESIKKYKRKLELLGVRIVPVISDSTFKKLGGGDVVKTVTSASLQHYTTASYGVWQNNEATGITILAQPATRKRHLFDSPEQYLAAQEDLRNGTNLTSGILHTAANILISVKRRDRNIIPPVLPNLLIVPMAIRLGRKSRYFKLNLFKKDSYTICAPLQLTSASTNDEIFRTDTVILTKIAPYIRSSDHYPNQCEL